MGDEKVETPAELKGSTYSSTVDSKATELKELLIEATMKDYDSLNKAIEHEWRLQNPDAIIYTPEAPTEEEAAAFRAKVKDEYYNWVEPAFERFYEVDPDATNEMIDGLAKTEGYFRSTGEGDSPNFQNGQLKLIGNAKTEMGFWHGSLQEEFLGKYLPAMETVADNSAAIAEQAKIQLLGNKLQYLRHRKKGLELLDKSIAAVKDLIANGGDDNGVSGGAWTWGTLVGISLGTIATIGTGGIAMVGAGLIVASTLAQGITPEDAGEKVELRGATAQDTAVNISNALSKEDTKLEESEKNVEKAFQTLLATILSVENYRSTAQPGPLTIHNPKLGGASNDKIGDQLLPGSG